VGQVFEGGGFACAGVAQEDDTGVFVHPFAQGVELNPLNFLAGRNPLAVFGQGTLTKAAG
jgi:hypothetical protein